MSAPLAAYFATQAPISGDDDFAALAALGLGPFGMARRAIQARRQSRGGGGRGSKIARAIRFLTSRGYNVSRYGEDELEGLGAMLGEDFEGFGAGEDFGGFGAGEDDDGEISADDAEIEGLGADEDDLSGDDDADVVGASLSRTEDKLSKLRAKLVRWEMKLDSTPEFRIAKRRRILRHIAKIKAKIAKKEARADRKRAKLAAKLGVPVAALAAGAGGALAMQARGASSAMQRAAAERAMGIGGTSARTPYGGEELRLPLLDLGTGAPLTVFSIPAGAGLRTVALAMQSAPLTYADFEVLGLDCRFQWVGGGAGEGLLSALAQTFQVQGGLNMLHQTEDVGFAGQLKDGVFTAFKTIAGLRLNDTLLANETAIFAGLIRQEITTTQTINGTFSASMVVRQTRDSKVRRTA